MKTAKKLFIKLQTGRRQTFTVRSYFAQKILDFKLLLYHITYYMMKLNYILFTKKKDIKGYTRKNVPFLQMDYNCGFYHVTLY